MNAGRTTLGAKTIKKNTNSTQNKSQTQCAKQYKVTSFLSTDCELSTNPCSKNVYSLGPRSMELGLKVNAGKTKLMAGRGGGRAWFIMQGHV